MAVAITDTLNDGLEFHITPDGRGRIAHKTVVIDEFPEDPESGLPTSEVRLEAKNLGLPWVEDAEVEGEGARWDADSASIHITEPGTYKVKAFGPPEFRNAVRD